MNNKKLYKSNNKKLAGVCGGIAEYFEVDPALIRLIWVIISLTTGVGFVAYIVAALLIDDNPAYVSSDVHYTEIYNEPVNTNTTDSDEIKGFKP
jgi:phage shock protein PspC (stress-responsive transcriptional regulator)